MSVSECYRQAWESYWRDTSDAPGEAIRDADPSLSAAPHLDLLAPHADPSEVLAEAGLRVLAEGPTTLAQTEQWPDGSRVEPPARWFVVSRRSPGDSGAAGRAPAWRNGPGGAAPTRCTGRAGRAPERRAYAGAGRGRTRGRDSGLDQLSTGVVRAVRGA